MKLLRKILGEQTDIIQWIDDSQDTLVWRFERYGNEIKYGAKLTVRESQVAIFVNEGEIADVISPGMYELETGNLPLLSTLQGWHYGFESPIKSEIYFCSTKQFVDVKWGTRKPVMVRDDELGPVRVRAFGNFSFRIEDPSRLIKEISGTDGHFILQEIQGELKTLISAKFSNIISNNEEPVLDLTSHIPEFEEQLLSQSSNEFCQYGLKLIRVIVENISLPHSVENTIDTLTGNRFAIPDKAEPIR